MLARERYNQLVTDRRQFKTHVTLFNSRRYIFKTYTRDSQYSVAISWIEVCGRACSKINARSTTTTRFLL